jgi:hypothetical protein
VITSTTISPNVDNTQFETISPVAFAPIEYQGSTLTPVCSAGTPYHFFVKRGTVNKLVMYYQGGGACWNALTCGVVGTFDKDVNPSGSDNPNNTIGLAPLGAPPIGDNWVSVPYHSTAVKASDLCTDIGLLSTGVNTGRGTVSRLIASTGVFTTPYVCGTNTALAFTLNTGDGARIRTPVAKSWLPSHF